MLFPDHANAFCNTIKGQSTGDALRDLRNLVFKKLQMFLRKFTSGM
jgi:hypothetical protein